jgi:hypothetical protein
MDKHFYRVIVFLVLIPAVCSSSAETQPARTQPSEGNEARERIAQLIATIDESPDPFHSESTPSVLQLIRIGWPALRPTLQLVLSKSEFTREHALNVISTVSAEMQGWLPGQGWPPGDAEKVFLEFWHKHGDLDSEASETNRRRAVELWNHWLDSVELEHKRK